MIILKKNNNNNLKYHNLEKKLYLILILVQEIVVINNNNMDLNQYNQLIMINYNKCFSCNNKYKINKCNQVVIAKKVKILYLI